MTNTTIQKTTRYTNVTAIADKFCCSQGHLSQVLHGKRVAGKALAAKLRGMGLTLPQDTARPSAPKHATRKALPLSLRSTARAIGCSDSHLARILNGERRPSAPLAAKLRGMGITLPQEN